MKTKWQLISFGFVGLMASWIGLSATALSQDESPIQDNYVPEDIAAKQVKFEGWDRYLGLSLYGTLTENENVVGKEDGQTTTLGLKVEGAVDYKRDNHEWLNSLDLLLSYSRTPLIPEYIKSEDTLEYESLYKIFFKSVSWLGGFTRFNFDTALYPGYDVQAEETSYRRVTLSGQQEIFTSDRVKLTDRFRPMRFRESVGAIAQIADNPLVSWDVKAGIGFRQVIADDQFVVSDNEATPEIDLQEVESYRKAGYELGSSLSGKTDDKKITYKLKGNVLFPVYESPSVEDDRDAFDKRIIDINGQVSFHLLEWASVDYLLKVLRDPDILNKAQVSQSFLFSVNRTLTPRRTH
jgi:hypothetical protein